VPQGHYNWSVNCTDALGYVNSSLSRVLTIDLTNPQVFTYFPGQEYNSSVTSINFNFSAQDNLDTELVCNITHDSSVNNTEYIVASNGSYTNYTISGISDGMHTWNITCIDNASNANTSQSRQYEVDTTSPSVTLDYPYQDDWLNSSAVMINYTPEDLNLESCELWANFSGTWAMNQTELDPANASTNNWSTVSLPDGSYIWNVRCNDSFQHSIFNETNRTFNVDSTYPGINYTYPTSHNATSFPRDWIFINVSANDPNEANITFRLYNTSEIINSTTLGKGNRSINFTNLNSNMVHYYNVTMRDYADNANTTLTRIITLSTSAPKIRLESPSPS